MKDLLNDDTVTLGGVDRISLATWHRLAYHSA